MTTSTTGSYSTTTLTGYAQLAIENTYNNPSNKELHYIYNDKDVNGVPKNELK